MLLMFKVIYVDIANFYDTLWKSHTDNFSFIVSFEILAYKLIWLLSCSLMFHARVLHESLLNQFKASITVNHGNYMCCQNDSNTQRYADVPVCLYARACMHAFRVIMHT